MWIVISDEKRKRKCVNSRHSTLESFSKALTRSLAYFPLSMRELTERGRGSVRCAMAITIKQADEIRPKKRRIKINAICWFCWRFVSDWVWISEMEFNIRRAFFLRVWKVQWKVDFALLRLESIFNVFRRATTKYRKIKTSIQLVILLTLLWILLRCFDRPTRKLGCLLVQMLREGNTIARCFCCWFWHIVIWLFLMWIFLILSILCLLIIDVIHNWALLAATGRMLLLDEMEFDWRLKNFRISKINIFYFLLVFWELWEFSKFLI